MKSENIFKDKINKIASPEKSKWEEKARWRVANKNWLLKSAAIALKILSTLKERNLPQVEFAQQMGTTPQNISKLLKGQENFTLETICKIENCLNIELINVPKYLTTIEIKTTDIRWVPNKTDFFKFKTTWNNRIITDDYDGYEAFSTENTNKRYAS